MNIKKVHAIINKSIQLSINLYQYKICIQYYKCFSTSYRNMKRAEFKVLEE
jgi:hypothetical protein